MNHFVKIVSFCNIKQQSTLIQSKLNITMVRVCNIYMNLIHVVNMLVCSFFSVSYLFLNLEQKSLKFTSLVTSAHFEMES